MRYFLDTEFDPTPGKAPILISLGIVDEKGNEFYAENLDYDVLSASTWVRDNVVPHLTGPAFEELDLLKKFISFVGQDLRPVFYCWVGAYDWFIIWDLMSKYQLYPQPPVVWGRDFREIKQLHEMFAPQLDVRDCSTGAAMHNALNDARWNKAVFDAIQEYTFIEL